MRVTSFFPVSVGITKVFLNFKKIIEWCINSIRGIQNLLKVIKALKETSVFNYQGFQDFLEKFSSCLGHFALFSLGVLSLFLINLYHLFCVLETFSRVWIIMCRLNLVGLTNV